MPLISFIIPCYRSEKTIRTVVSEIISVVTQRPSFTYEIICVNDHSPDNVWEVLEKLAGDDPHITAIDLARNFGQHAALMAGYRQAVGDYIFSLDDDGQAPVEAIYSCINKLDEGYDVVIGKYEQQLSASCLRKLGSFFARKMSEIMTQKPKAIQLSTFRVMKPFVRDEICRYQGCFPFTSGLLFRTTLNCANVPVKHHARLEGTSGYSIRKLLNLWLNGFTAFSVKPLRVASWLGALVACLGFSVATITIIRKFLNPNIAIGYTSLLAAILLIGGCIMLMLGIIGEYIGRIYICLNNSPQYVIRQIVKSSAARQ